MSMTPFEIRLELLKMAKEMLAEDFYSKRDQVNNTWQTQCEFANTRGAEIPAHPDYPLFPTETQVIEKAAVLNNFVSQR